MKLTAGQLSLIFDEALLKKLCSCDDVLADPSTPTKLSFDEDDNWHTNMKRETNIETKEEDNFILKFKETETYHLYCEIGKFYSKISTKISF